MKFDVTWTEEWTRRAQIEVPDQDLIDWIGHQPPFERREVREYLREVAYEPGEWLHEVGNLDVNAPGVEFSCLEIETVSGEDLKPTELGVDVSAVTRRPVENVVRTL